MRSVLSNEMDLILKMYDRKIKKYGFYAITRYSNNDLKKMFTLNYKDLFLITKNMSEGKGLSREQASYSILKLRRMIALWEKQGIFSIPGGVYYSIKDKNEQFPMFSSQSFNIVPTIKTIKSIQAKIVKEYIDNYNNKITQSGLGNRYLIKNLKDLRNSLMKNQYMKAEDANKIVKIYGQIAASDELANFSKTI